MLELAFDVESGRPPTILCLGAHSDDIEIGCGGAIMQLLDRFPGASVHWVVFSADDARADEARASAADFLAKAGVADVDIHRFRESYFPYIGDQLKEAFEVLKHRAAPDVVFSHRRHDEHQDHATIAALTWNTFRDHLILEYEIPKYEGDLGQPNFFVPVDAGVAERKIDLLMEHFPSQRGKRWFRPETFRGLMALRAVECNSRSGWAEGFHVRKIVLAGEAET